QHALPLREPLNVLGLRPHCAYTEPVCALNLLAVGAAAARVDRDTNAGHGYAFAGVPLLWVRSQIPDDLYSQHDELLALEGHHYSRITEPIDDARLLPSPAQPASRAWGCARSSAARRPSAARRLGTHPRR